MAKLHFATFQQYLYYLHLAYTSLKYSVNLNDVLSAMLTIITKTVTTFQKMATPQAMYYRKLSMEMVLSREAVN